jgi:F420-non-reducing hydrogenase iron-sulfur subunit
MEGNYNTLRRMALLRRVLREMGIENARLRLEWISASEGEKVARVIREMTESLRALGPLDLPGMRRRWDTELAPHPAAEAPIHQLAAGGR